MPETKIDIQPAEGKLGVLLVGLGAVSTTFIAGVEAVKKGLAEPIGSLTQMGTIRIGKRTDNKTPFIKDFVPLAGLDSLVFGAWDVYGDNAYDAALKAGVLEKDLLNGVKEELTVIKPMSAVFQPEYAKRLKNYDNVKAGGTKMDLAEKLIADIQKFKADNGCDRLVMVWAASTEIFLLESKEHETIESFEKAMRNDSPQIAPSMVYAYAAIKSGVPFAMGAPNLAIDTPALTDLANQLGVPICGKDFKTGQTLMKTILAPGLKSRSIGINGWFSTNILGNRDGEVLDDPDNFKTKEESKLGVLETILEPKLNPKLYGNTYHKIRIEYYPPRGDDKEGWDNIDIFGWLGYKMQIKIDFLCKDSILAAPLVLDLALFLDLAQRSKMKGVQEWLSFYFKAPQTAPGLKEEHDIFIQQMKLKNTLRHIQGEESITHLGLDYYD
ncbi:MAG TPA: inositol-3-phosphate synthase [Candidatus Paceibacterota bacterium]|jgi:myo-inositol-1-phosphate synthase|nr:inositol-3-phosphate synthase [Candidatus Paceibacterota bacterium]